jgi:WhiB family transcriptional regulator, redox-sensing transcriptional regulator
MTALDNRADWWSRAACSTADPDLFFPVSGAGPAAQQVARAKAICARCQIQDACLGYALAAGNVQGVWGGTTEEDRRLLLRRPAGAAGPGASGGSGSAAAAAVSTRAEPGGRPARTRRVWTVPSR